MTANNNLTFNIHSYTAELCYSKKSGDEMVKLRLYDENVAQITEVYLMLNHPGFARERSIQILITMLKDPNDYAELANSDGGITVDKILRLLDEPDYRNLYFKEFSKVTLATEGHIVSLISWEFK